MFDVITTRHENDPRYAITRRISDAYQTTWAFDCETFLITPARLVPPMVCLTHAMRSVQPSLLHAKYDRAAVKQIVLWALTNDVLIVGANTAFDLAEIALEFPELLPLIFAAYEQDRVVDVQLAQQLIDIATNAFRGRYDQNGTWIEHDYNLAALVKRHFGRERDKTTFRFDYGSLFEVEPTRWSDGQKLYALDDASDALQLWTQVIDTPQNQAFLYDIFRQGRAAWWSHLMMAWGFALDREHILTFKKKILDEWYTLAAKLRAAGLVRYNDKRDTKAAMERMRQVCALRGIKMKETAGEDIALDEEACLDSGDPILKDYARYTSLSTILTKDIPALEEPAIKGVPIQSRFDTLIATGRMACSGGAKKKKKKPGSNLYTFQLHNVRREPGVREAFVPRSGFYLLSCDYIMFELHGWAQVCIEICGFSDLAQALIEKRDVHLDLGAQLLGISYEEALARKFEEAVKDARQCSKPGNFGLPGGMGWRAFQAWVKANYGIVLSNEKAQQIQLAWKRRWREHRPYFDFVSRITGTGEGGTIVHGLSQRVRAGVPYTVACNSFFQGRAADCAKDAGFKIAEACYRIEGSPLFGSRIVNFVHDEFIMEVPIERAHEASMEVVRLMEDAGTRWMPNVPPRAEPALMSRWMKAAEPVWCDGRLITWTPTIGAVRKAHGKKDRAKVVQLFAELSDREQRAMLQEGVAA